MNTMIEGPWYAKAVVCEPILRLLPAWFGIEEAIVHYVAEIDQLPPFLASRSGQIVGFISLKQHTPYAAEVYVMGIRIETHRMGIGRALMEKAQAWLQDRGVEYLQVKTLGPSHSDEYYAKTRAFYEALGFRPLEEFKQLWDEHNPCLLMIKKL